MLDSVSCRAAFIPVRAGTRLCVTSSQLGRQTLEHQNDGKLAATEMTGHSRPTRASLAFRLSSALVVGLLVLLVADLQGGMAAGTALTWSMASLAGAAVFVFSDILLPLLIVATPPGLLILAVIGLRSA